MRDKRPEWLWCILTGRYDIPMGEPGGPHKEAKTWCGRDLKGYGEEHFCFIDASHAAINADNEGRLVPCRACAKAISDALLKHAAAYDPLVPEEDESDED